MIGLQGTSEYFTFSSLIMDMNPDNSPVVVDLREVFYLP